jgi:hypothetical protein
MGTIYRAPRKKDAGLPGHDEHRREPGESPALRRDSIFRLLRAFLGKLGWAELFEGVPRTGEPTRLVKFGKSRKWRSLLSFG